jgi:hypothetical protein
LEDHRGSRRVGNGLQALQIVRVDTVADSELTSIVDFTDVVLAKSLSQKFPADCSDRCGFHFAAECNQHTGRASLPA